MSVFWCPVEIVELFATSVCWCRWWWWRRDFLRARLWRRRPCRSTSCMTSLVTGSSSLPPPSPAARWPPLAWPSLSLTAETRLLSAVMHGCCQPSCTADILCYGTRPTYGRLTKVEVRLPGELRHHTQQSFISQTTGGRSATMSGTETNWKELVSLLLIRLTFGLANQCDNLTDHSLEYATNILSENTKRVKWAKCETKLCLTANMNRMRYESYTEWSRKKLHKV